MRRVIELSLQLSLILIPLIFTTGSYELFEFPKFILLLSLTLVVAVFWFFDAYQNSDWTLPRSPLTLPVLAFLASQTLSTVFSIDPYTSFWGYYSRFHQGLLTTVCYTILFFATLKYVGKDKLSSFIKISLGTAVAISLYAILQRLGIDKKFWIQDVVNRPFSTLGQPNWMAAYLIPNIFLALYYFGKIPVTPALKNLVFLALYAALAVSKSRSAYLAFAISFGLYWLAAYSRTRRLVPIAKQLTPHLVLISAGILLMGTVWTSPLTTYLKNLRTPQETSSNLPTSPIPSVGGTESGDIRKIVWTGALDLFRSRPLLGTGVETFAYSYYWKRPVAHNYVSEWDFLYNKAHNEYLNLLATSGILGLATNLTLPLAFVAFTLRKLKSSTPKSSLLPVAVSAGLVSTIITNFFGFSVIPVALLFYLLPALAVSTAKSPQSAQENIRVPLLVSGVLLILPARLFLADLYFSKSHKLASLNPSEAHAESERAISLRASEPLYYSTYGETAAQLAAATSGSEETRELSLAYQNRAASAADFMSTRAPYNLNLVKSRAKIFLTLAEIDPSHNITAAKVLEKAIELAPTDPKLAYNLGLVYSRIGNTEGAIREIRRAIDLKKDYDLPYYALALLYEETKQPDLIPPLLQEAKINLSVIPDTLRPKFDKYLPQSP